MTKIKVGINGFGRIGRLVFRAAMTRNDIEIVAINDPSELDYLVYTLKYDTVHGRFNGTIEIKDGELYVDGRHILVTSSREPEGLKWGEAGVDYAHSMYWRTQSKKKIGTGALIAATRNGRRRFRFSTTTTASEITATVSLL